MMKKIILTSLFSATLLVGGVSHTAFAEENLPSNPTTPPSEEVTPPSIEDSTTPSDPVLPPDTGDSGTGGDTGTTTPPNTGDSGTGGDTGTTTPPDTGNSEIGGNTGTTTPPNTGDSGTSGEDTGTTTPPDTGNSGNSGGSDTSKPTPPNTGDSHVGGSDTNKPTPPSTGNTNTGNTGTTPPTINVGVNSDGTINSSGNGTQMTPIQTNDVNELTHIPTASTPVETDTGEKIVSVVDGVAYKQTNDGTLTPIKAEVKQLPSGNIAVKGSDGQLKVLPKTGSKQTVLMTVLGSLLTLGTGVVWWKKRI
ncbi:LPXTG cell wall anchor domain-containing protein [Enterococcus hirae]